MKIGIHQLVKRFGDVVALKSLDLAIADGELFFILGPSGCGKTTLLRCIGGFEMPTSGQICFDGQDVAALPANKRNTAMVFQGYALWPHMTVWENVAFGLQMRNMPKEEMNQRVRTALEGTQIWEYRNRKPNELSGGQQQRVALARTLVVEPGCLLLDEPLANLDAKLRREMRSEIRGLCKRHGLTGIYVTHDRSEALTMADRMVVLKDGEIVQIGTPEEVYRRPVNAFVATFMGEANLLPGKVISEGIATAAGVLHSNDTAASSEVTLVIRPEAISLSPHYGSDGDNVLEAELVSTEYLGEVAKHQAAVNGVKLDFLELNPRAQAPAERQVKLYIRRDDIRVVEKM